MSKGDHLGEFEILILAAVERIGHDSYGVTIQRELEARADRAASIGAIHATLARLADKGYVAFRISDPLPIPGGRARKYARATPAGRRALQQAVDTMLKMVHGLELDVRR